MSRIEDEHEEFKRRFQHTLNSHGYSFMYAVVSAAHDAFDAHTSKWLFEVTEFPVEVQGRGTRIDLILKHQSMPIFLVGECKRANPAYSDWCFVRAPYTMRHENSGAVVFDRIQVVNDNPSNFSFGNMPHVAVTKQYGLGEIYHIAIEVKSNKKGDANAGRSDAIEGAAGQVCLGLNGYIHTLHSNSQIWKAESKAYVLPVILTTADLWVSSADLKETDLLTGEIDTSASDLTKADWVLYQYHMAPGLKYGTLGIGIGPTEKEVDTLGKIMQHRYIRTIFIVNAGAIAKFLQWSSKFDFD